jgi:TolB-like protein/Tfp pilus assembly protein PilF
MADEQKAKQRLEIAHVLFMDIVDYSKLLTDEQSEALQELNQIVRNTETARGAEAAGQLTILPTGDGMALVFTGSVEEPVECALEISHALRAQPSLPVRMGIHSGPVHHVKDANQRENVAGVGINIAQRVMDCGDAGHILVSKRVADDLAQQRRWQPYLHELGDVEVKHGVVVSLVNLYAETIGNPTPPSRIGKVRGSVRTFSKGTRKALSPVARAIFIIAGLLIALIFALAIVSVIFAPAIMRTPDKHGSATVPQPSATAPPSLADTIKSAVAKKITDELQDELSGKKNASVEPPPPSSAVPEKSIAVLPFENLSEDKSNAYFAEGIQDEILTRLSKIADLKVISRTSTQKYASAPDNLRDIGKQLGVANLLEGSVQKSGDAVRVNVQLIKAATDSHLWADTFDRKLTDIFSVESEVAKAIADQLRAKLTGHEEQVIAAKPTDNPEAYDAYLRGLAYSLKTVNTSANALAAQKCLREAVRLDPKFALSWALLSYVEGRSYLTLTLQPTVALREEARQAAETAVTLQPNLGEAVLAKGYYHYACLKDYDTAVLYFEQARQLLPNNSRIPESLAYVARRRGQWDRSEAYFNEAERLDPRDVSLLTQHALSYICLRHFPDALRKLDQVLDITPDDVDTLVQKAAVAQAEGDLPRASAILAPLHLAAEDPIALDKQVYQAILERRPAQIISWLKEILAKPDPALGYINGELRFLLGWAQEVAGDHGAAQESWQQARSELEPFLKGQPENYLLMDALALTNMGLGNKAAALALSERAMAANPIEKDAVTGPFPIEVLARVAARMGEPDRAIATLGKLLSMPYESPLASNVPLTPALLRLDPMFDPLRNDPRFQKLCEDKPK